jgi:hypothetical protein
MDFESASFEKSSSLKRNLKNPLQRENKEKQRNRAKYFEEKSQKERRKSQKKNHYIQKEFFSSSEIHEQELYLNSKFYSVLYLKWMMKNSSLKGDFILEQNISYRRDKIKRKIYVL